MLIDRQFVRLSQGLVHYRCCGQSQPGPPLLVMHPSPASSAFMAPLVGASGATRPVFAPDTPGNGDSEPLPEEQPEMADYAAAMMRVLDELEIEQCDVYGFHTGSHIGIELALRIPDRVRRLALHGLAVLSAEDQLAYLKHYAPRKAPDEIGSQFNWAWHYVRDQMIFYPHFRKTADHIRAGGRLDPDYLHRLTLDVLKSLEHYHKAYHAVFRHAVLERLAEVSVPTLLLSHPGDPLANAVEQCQAALPAARVHLLADHEPQTLADALADFAAR